MNSIILSANTNGTRKASRRYVPDKPAQQNKSDPNQAGLSLNPAKVHGNNNTALNMLSMPAVALSELEQGLRVEGTRSSINQRRQETHSACAAGSEVLSRFVFSHPSGSKNTQMQGGL